LTVGGVTSSETFSLPKEMRARIIDQARREFPRECCGVISGVDGNPRRLHETRNIAEGNKFYEIDPEQLIELEFRELPKDNSEIIAIYHSHPASVAYPSQTDLDLAFWSRAIYLICSLEDPQNPYIRGFRIDSEARAIVEVELTT
jgi:[CysO sulfur-carrier protein]-S-L-cysteine hydrolase